jgi:hypothetical protein
MGIELVGLAASILSTAAGTLLPVALKYIQQIRDRHASRTVDASQITSDIEVDSRLTEARRMLKRQRSTASWNRSANSLLTFGQYIVGGVLATSFVQDSLDSRIVGLLGVLVLASSLVHQYYRPDLVARSAAERYVQLRVLIRQAEDEIFARRSETTDAKSVLEVRRLLTAGLEAIDYGELDDLLTRGDVSRAETATGAS